MGEEPKSWGGSRVGAGRPRLENERRTASGFSLPPDALQAIAERSRLEGVTRSEALTRCVREWQAARAEQEAT